MWFEFISYQLMKGDPTLLVFVCQHSAPTDYTSTLGEFIGKIFVEEGSIATSSLEPLETCRTEDPSLIQDIAYYLLFWLMVLRSSVNILTACIKNWTHCRKQKYMCPSIGVEETTAFFSYFVHRIFPILITIRKHQRYKIQFFYTEAHL